MRAKKIDVVRWGRTDGEHHANAWLEQHPKAERSTFEHKLTTSVGKSSTENAAYSSARDNRSLSTTAQAWYVEAFIDSVYKHLLRASYSVKS